MVGVVVGGAGAFGRKHLAALAEVDDAEVIGIVEPVADLANEAAEMFGIQRTWPDLADALAVDEVDAVILTSPTPMHATQAIQCMDAGKHVEVEIPAADLLPAKDLHFSKDAKETDAPAASIWL